MTKARVQVTTEWQQIATGAAIFTVERSALGHLFLNESEDDATAYRGRPDQNHQFQQTSALPTYVKATVEGWEIIVDGAI